MDLLIDKESSVQINEQIMAQLRYQIINGELEQDSRLPSARELASLLNVNRHTVSKAYKELENEGLIVTKQSLGTFVGKDIEIPKKQDIDRFVNTIKEAMEVSNLIGFTSKEFLAMTEYIYLKEKNNKKVKGLFVECNDIALRHYMSDINEKLDIDIDGCLLEDINEEYINSEGIKEYDLIMTTVAHYPELKRKLKDFNNLYALNFGPFLQILNKIINLPKETNIGIVCVNEVGTLALKQILLDLGAIQGFIIQGCTKNLDKVKELANNVDILIVSKFALEENAEFFSTLSKKVIEYTNVLQGSSVRMLQEVIIHIKQSKEG